MSMQSFFYFWPTQQLSAWVENKNDESIFCENTVWLQESNKLTQRHSICAAHVQGQKEEQADS